MFPYAAIEYDCLSYCDTIFYILEIIMIIKTSDIVEGGIYKTVTGQQRKVTKIENDCVHYMSKGKDSSKPWTFGHNKTNPPKLSTFKEACSEVVSKP